MAAGLVSTARMIALDIAAQQSLISVASAGFGPSKKAEYVKVLRFLAENSGRDRRRERTRDIRLVLPEDYGVDLSTYLKRIQHLLDKFFDSPAGQQHERRIQVVIGRPGEHHPDLYDLRFPLNTNSLVKRFWIMDATAETYIVYGLPMFVRDSDPITFRRIADRNLEAEEPPGTDVRFPFVAHGDLLAAVALTELFTSQHVPVRLGAFKAQHTVKNLLKETPRNSDAVILGSVRVSGILEEYQSTHVLEPSDGQPARYLPFRLRIHDVVRMDDHGQAVGEPFAEETGLPRNRRARSDHSPAGETRRVGCHAHRVQSRHGRLSRSAGAYGLGSPAAALRSSSPAAVGEGASPRLPDPPEDRGPERRDKGNDRHGRRRLGTRRSGRGGFTDRLRMVVVLGDRLRSGADVADQPHYGTRPRIERFGSAVSAAGRAPSSEPRQT